MKIYRFSSIPQNRFRRNPDATAEKNQVQTPIWAVRVPEPAQYIGVPYRRWGEHAHQLTGYSVLVRSVPGIAG